MIVPLPAGAAVDTVARILTQRLTHRLGQTIVIENRPGASGAIGAEAVAKAPADGYTLGMATSSTHVTISILNARLPYDPSGISCRSRSLVSYPTCSPYRRACR